MLNLRDPSIKRYETETVNACDSPSRAEPLSLTTVVMHDISTFQTGVEAPIGKFPRIFCGNSQADLCAT